MQTVASRNGIDLIACAIPGYPKEIGFMVRNAQTLKVLELVSSEDARTAWHVVYPLLRAHAR